MPKETYYMAKETYSYGKYSVRTVDGQCGQFRYAGICRSLLPCNRFLLTLTHTSGMLVLVGLFCLIIGLF